MNDEKIQRTQKEIDHRKGICFRLSIFGVGHNWYEERNFFHIFYLFFFFFFSIHHNNVWLQFLVWIQNKIIYTLSLFNSVYSFYYCAQHIYTHIIHMVTHPFENTFNAFYWLLQKKKYKKKFRFINFTSLTKYMVANFIFHFSLCSFFAYENKLFLFVDYFHFERK